MNVHQHDPSATVRDEFDCGFTSFAIAAHREILRGSNGGSCREPKTGLVIDDPYPYPLVRHLRIMRRELNARHGVHTTLFMVRTSLPVRRAVVAEEHQHSLDPAVDGVVDGQAELGKDGIDVLFYRPLS